MVSPQPTRPSSVRSRTTVRVVPRRTSNELTNGVLYGTLTTQVVRSVRRMRSSLHRGGGEAGQQGGEPGAEGGQPALAVGGGRAGRVVGEPAGRGPVPGAGQGDTLVGFGGVRPGEGRVRRRGRSGEQVGAGGQQQRRLERAGVAGNLHRGFGL